MHQMSLTQRCLHPKGADQVGMGNVKMMQEQCLLPTPGCSFWLYPMWVLLSSSLPHGVGAGHPSYSAILQWCTLGCLHCLEDTALQLVVVTVA